MENVSLNSENFKEFHINVQQIPSHQTREAPSVFSFIENVRCTPIHTFIHLVVCLTQVHSIFFNEFSTECDLVFPISISSVLFSFKSSGMCVRLLLLLLPVTSILPSTFSSILCVGSSYTRCGQST